jgi:hypothetical protein
VDPQLTAQIEAAGASPLPHPSTRDYAQFAKSLTLPQYAALDRLFAAQPELWLRTYSYGSMDHVSFLAHLPSVRRVNLDHGPVRDWSGLAMLPPALEELEFGDYAKGPPLMHLAGLSALRRLKIAAPAAAKDYPHLGKLRSLTELSLKKANLGSARAEAMTQTLPQLRHLRLDSCQLGDLRFLRHLTRLESLTIHGGARAVELETLPPLPSLKLLELSSITAATLNSLAPLKRLERLQIADFTTLRDVGALQALASLRSLYLGGFPRLSKLPSLAGSSKLSDVDLYLLPALASLRGVADAPALSKLSVIECDRLRVAAFRPFVGRRLSKLNLKLWSRVEDARVRKLLGLP